MDLDSIVVVLRRALSNPSPPFRRLAKILRRGKLAESNEHPRREAATGVQELTQQQRRLSPVEASELVDAYRAGAAQRDLARRFGIHRTTVTAHLRRAGVSLRSTEKLTQDTVAEAAALYEQGWSLARIATKFDVYPQSVRYRLLAFGVRMRDTHGRER
jgi:DNA-binding transcriptional ArsR family regulator